MMVIAQSKLLDMQESLENLTSESNSKSHGGICVCV